MSFNGATDYATFCVWSNMRNTSQTYGIGPGAPDCLTFCRFIGFRIGDYQAPLVTDAQLREWQAKRDEALDKAEEAKDAIEQRNPALKEED